MPRIRCPQGEQRGAVVFCRAVNRPVNPLVLPCASPKYERCKFYKQALPETTLPPPRLNRKEEKPREATPTPPPPAPPGERVEPEGVPEARVVERAKVAEERPRRVVPEVLRDWSLAESQKISDPAEVAMIIIQANLVMASRIEAKGIEELAQRLSGVEGWNEKCFMVDAMMDDTVVYMKFCKGKLIASATQGSIVLPERLEEIISKAGRIRVTVYGPVD